YATSALLGSSYYRLPRVLQWFSGNIGFHHIHHLSPKIPNYKLQRCHEENPLFQESTVLGIRASLKSASMKLWDEERQRMVGFNQLKTEWDRLRPLSRNSCHGQTNGL
ncbi:MAG TPA: fatty acid desaturase, partial [Blastocatellia bacterium]|nr:fatty acid desaturase [Blastocatellia bacterium]